MSKQIRMTTRPRENPDADAWVEKREGIDAPPKTKPKRLTIDIDPELHTRLKLRCVERDVRIADFLRELIEAKLDAENEN